MTEPTNTELAELLRLARPWTGKNYALQAQIDACLARLEPLKVDPLALLSCPFCGGKAIIWGACGRAPEQWVKCNRCAASSDTASGNLAAANKWNRREVVAPALPKPVPDEVQEAADYVKARTHNHICDITLANYILELVKEQGL